MPMFLIRTTSLIVCAMTLVTTAYGAENNTSGLRSSAVRDNLFVISGPEDANTGNVAAYITDEGVILVDDKFEQHVDAILGEVSTLTDQPVRYVFNTHHHLDHSGGNKSMLEIAEVIAHDNARRNMKEPIGSFGSDRPASDLPRVTFSEGMSVHLGGKEVQAHYFGRGHTDGDVVIYFPAERVIHTGDLYVPGGFLVDAAAGGSALAWDATLRAVLKLDFDTIIPGHLNITVSREDLVQHIRDFETVRNRIQLIIQSGGTREELRERLKLDDLEGWGTNPWIPAASFLRRSFEELYDELADPQDQ